MIARIGAVAAFLVLLVMPVDAAAQATCDEKCKSIFVGGLFQGYECVTGADGFDCDVDEHGCVIERTGCGGETEEEADLALLVGFDPHVQGARFGFGFLRAPNGGLLFAMVPCPKTEREVFAVQADALNLIAWSTQQVDRE
ncbi:MAG: hypothetical protein SGI84_13080 [Gemmatimonadota bacterium]|nr:hypothetical protein [Gemmatimonadota bacterium]